MAGPSVTDSTNRNPDAIAAVPVSSLAAEFDRLAMCIHCGFCLDACPTYTRGGDEADSPRGRLYLMRAVAEGRIPAGSGAFRTHLDRCLGCRACEPVCPSGVEYGFLMERGREAIGAARGISFLERLLLATFGSPALNRMAGFFARIVRGTGLAALAVRIVPERFRRLRMAAAMLEASRPWKGLRRSARNRDAPAAGSRQPESADRSRNGVRVAMLEGCVQKTLFERVNTATADVLSYNGHHVVAVRGQGCCGALHAHAGDLEGARRLARNNLEVFGRLLDGQRAGSIDAIVVNAAGCGAMMKDYGKLFEHRPEYERAVEVSSRVRDPLVFLAEHGVRAGASPDVRAAWDWPCHLLHGQRSGDVPFDTLKAAIPGLAVTVVPHADECCGGAGIHALVHGGYGDRVLADKLAAVDSVGPDIVLTANPGCIMQIGGGFVLRRESVRAVHPMELVASACS